MGGSDTGVLKVIGRQEWWAGPRPSRLVHWWNLDPPVFHAMLALPRARRPLARLSVRVSGETVGVGRTFKNVGGKPKAEDSPISPVLALTWSDFSLEEFEVVEGNGGWQKSDAVEIWVGSS